MEDEISEANSRISNFIDRIFENRREEEYIKECLAMGIFPMFTTGVLCDELNRLGSHIRHQDKFGELERIREVYGK